MAPKYHAFVCTTSRPAGHPRGCCTSKGGGQPLYDRLLQKFQQGMLWEKGVSIAQASCLGTCNAGPVMVVYPDNVWYQIKTAEDIDEIVASHFGQGKPVERLVFNP
ncbi:MAG: (2Fe-2S) ferredoxin domain-containing protein [Magnetospirillum sp.]|nr:(2Fe-2S) ferredoxin domain-containing protein [Magnetospirillum sp.]